MRGIALCAGGGLVSLIPGGGTNKNNKMPGAPPPTIFHCCRIGK